MRKMFSLLISLMLLVTILGSNAYAMEVAQDDFNTVIKQDETIREVTPQEYYEMIAQARNISVKDAEKITKQLISEHQRSLKEAKKTSNDDEISTQSISWGTSWSSNGGKYYHVVIYKQQNEGGGMVIEVGVPGIVYLYGSYAREFVSIDTSATYARPVTSGTYTYSSATLVSSLINNEVHLNTRGTTEVTTTIAQEMGVSIADLLSYGFSTSNNFTYRKTTTIAHIEKLY